MLVQYMNRYLWATKNDDESWLEGSRTLWNQVWTAYDLVFFAWLTEGAGGRYPLIFRYDILSIDPPIKGGLPTWIRITEPSNISASDHVIPLKWRPTTGAEYETAPFHSALWNADVPEDTPVPPH